jgi:Ser/Thr protein kinase RdoA (MazF antagonist)
VKSLDGILRQRWGLSDASFERATRGHTNQTFFVRAGDRAFALRRSWPNKPNDGIAREETLLSALATHARALPVPRLVPTLDGAPHAIEDAPDGARCLHLFERLPGTPRDSLDDATGSELRAAAVALEALHAALARLPDGDGADPIEWLRDRWSRVEARGATGLPSTIAAELPRLAAILPSLFEAVTALAGAGASQWLHGDYHVGNLLFERGELSGIVDFDDTGRGAPAIERALALFALSRDVTAEDRFRYNSACFDVALAAFPAAAPMVADRPLAERLFCADQVLIHLEACQRGLWSLGPGIGFQPCWASLLRR